MISPIDSLQARREALGLNALQFAERAGCPVDTVVRVELGLRVPHAEDERTRLAAAYRLPPADFLRLALDAADRRAASGI